MMSLTIGEKIAALRKAKNITQTQLAEYLFLVPQTISAGCNPAAENCGFLRGEHGRIIRQVPRGQGS